MLYVDLAIASPMLWVAFLGGAIMGGIFGFYGVVWIFAGAPNNASAVEKRS
jgi:hypothetical protein